MKTIAEKVLKVFEREGGNSVKYFTEINEIALIQVNEAFIELGKLNIYGQLVEIENGLLTIEFLKV